MIIISSSEFRQNQKKYLDLADRNERVIIQRGSEKTYELLRNFKNDRFFDNPAVRERLKKSLQSHKEGKTVKLSDDQLQELLGI